MKTTANGAATFYQYKLIKKINLNKNLLRLYVTLPLVVVMLETIFISPWSGLYILIATPMIFWIQYVISRSVLLISGHFIYKKWGLSIRFPWLGYMPDQHISYGIFRKVQLHNFWIGICIAALFIPWSPPGFAVSLIASHLWLVLPRLYTLILFNRENKEGLLKLNPTDISYYSQ